MGGQSFSVRWFIGCARAAIAAGMMGGVAAPTSAQEVGASADEGGAIIVTAQRREQRLQDVPIYVNALSTEQIEAAGVDGLGDIFNLVAGVDFNDYGLISATNLFVRGVGSAMTDGGVETSVGLYVDDVYIGSQEAYNAALFDIERVEILRGPQGTLYGKNVLGGAVRLFNGRPEADAFVRGQFTYGNYDYLEARLTLNAPIVSDSVLARVSGTYRETGYPNPLDNRSPGDGESKGVRAAVTLLPGERWSIDLAADYGEDDLVGRRNPSPFVPAADYIYVGENRKAKGFSVTVKHEADFADLTSITGYRDMTFDTYLDGDLDLSHVALLSEQDIKFDQFSQELRLASNGDGPVEWVVGAFYYKDTSDYEVPFTFGFAGGGLYPPGYTEVSNAKLQTETMAAYMDATWAATERLSLSAGLRYTDETKRIHYRHASNYSDADFTGLLAAANLDGQGDGFDQDDVDILSTMLLGVPAGVLSPADFPSLLRLAPLQTYRDRKGYTDFSPRAVVSYRWSDDLMTYASVSRGFKSGGFNSLFVTAQDQFAFGSESAWNYEAGFKSTLFDKRLTFNLSAYRLDWKDKQARAVVVGTNGSFQVLISNAEKAVSQGIDLELSARIMPGLQASFAYSYIDASYKSFPNAPSGDASGNRLPLIPKHAVNVGVDYTAPIAGDWNAVLHADYVYRSRRISDDANTPLYALGSYSTVNVRIGVENEAYEVSLWANNLFDEDYSLFAGPDQSTGGIDNRLGRPRSYGVRVTGRF